MDWNDILISFYSRGKELGSREKHIFKNSFSKFHNKNMYFNAEDRRGLTIF